MGADDVIVVRQILQIGLQAQLLGQGVKQRGVGAREAGDDDGVVESGPHVGLMDKPESAAEARQDAVVVPQREGVVGHQGRLLAESGGGGGAADIGILISVAAGHGPLAGEVSVDAEFEAVGALAAGLNNDRRIVGIHGARVGAVQAVQRGREGEVALHVPLDARFVVGELLGLQRLRGGVERAELVPRTGQVGDAVVEIDRQREDGLEDHAGTRRNHVVHAAEAGIGAIIVELEVEAIEADASDQLYKARQVDLILKISCGYGVHGPVVGVGGGRAEGHRSEIRRIGEGDADGGCRVVEIGRLAEVVCCLAPEFRAHKHGVPHGTRVGHHREVRLVEGVVALRAVVVTGQAHHGLGGVHRSGKNVLVELVVGAEQGVVAQVHSSAELALHGGRSEMDTGVARAFVRIAEEGGTVGAGRPAAERGNAAVGDALIAEVFVSEADFGERIGREGDRGSNAVAAQVEVVAEAVGILEHGVEAECRLIAQRLADVAGDAFVAERTALQGQLAQRREAGFLGDAINDAATAAAAEDHGVRTLHGLHAFEVV